MNTSTLYVGILVTVQITQSLNVTLNSMHFCTFGMSLDQQQQSHDSTITIMIVALHWVVIMPNLSGQGTEIFLLLGMHCCASEAKHETQQVDDSNIESI